MKSNACFIIVIVLCAILLIGSALVATNNLVAGITLGLLSINVSLQVLLYFKSKGRC